MIRSGKKLRTSNVNNRSTSQNNCAAGAGAGTSLVSSGNFMTSSLHDDPNDDVDMPIPSPDATNNQVLDTINPEQDHIAIEPATKVNEIVSVIEPRILSKQQQQVRAADDNYVNVASVTRFHADIVNGKTISGGLTLDKKNKSLKNLIYYIRTAYSNNLTSPKWKNFKGLRLQVMEKIRLNNVIWRTWFEQYGIKDVSKRKRPLVCQFANTLEETTNSTNLAILEGKYWKRRLESITNEYKKWREISRKRLKPSQPINFDNLLPRALNNSNNNHSNSNLFGFNTSNVDNTNIHNNNQIYATNTNNLSEINVNYNYNYYPVNNNMSVGNVYDYNINHNPGCFTNINTNNANNTNGTFYSGQINNNNNNSGFPGDLNNLGNIGSSFNPNQLSSNQHFHHISSTTNKQMTYNNRCRSPSPGLFQDFDLFSFSSDTLFSTHCFEDPKESIIGTNPDLCQPDLLHLYPNFDFLELDVGFHDNTPSINSSGLLTTPNQLKSSHMVTNSPKLSGKSINRSQNTSLFNPVSQKTSNPLEIEINQQHQQPDLPQQHLSRHELQNPSKLTSINAGSQLENTNQQLMEPKQNQTFPADNYDNFNTLATVAAASPSISPSRNQQQKIYSISIDQNYDNLNQIKQPAATSPLNSKLNASNVEIMQTSQTAYISNHRSTNGDIINQPINSIPSIVSSASNAASSNTTIRDLLSLNSPSLAKEFNSNGQTTLSFGDTSISKKVANKEMPSLKVHSASPLLIDKLNPKLDNNNNNNPNNMQMSALLNAVLAPSLSTEIELAAINNEPAKQIQPQAVTTHKKRGRKSNSVKAEEAANVYTSLAIPNNQRHDEINFAEQQIVPTKTTHSSNYSSAKSVSLDSGSNKISGLLNKNSAKNLNKKIEPTADLNIDNMQLMYNSQYNQREQPSQQEQSHYPPQYRNFKKQFISSNSDNNSVQSPMDSPSSNSSNFNSPNPVNHLQFQQQLNHANSENNLNMTSPTVTGSNVSANFLLNNDDSNYLNKFNTIQASATASNIDFGLVKSNKLSNSNNIMSQEFMNFSASLNGTSSRQASRSNSVNSNTFNDANLSSAEQKRRCNIQHGFDHLQTLVPSLGEGGKNSKASKAAMLQKTSEYIKELQLAREKRMKDLAVYRREIEQLSEKISECQNQLPANGVNVTGNLNKTEKFEQKFNAYVKEKTVENWKFYLFSLILRPLFNNFVTTLNTSSKEDMERTFYEWQQKYCNLTQLRPIASNALRHLSKSTSILSDSSKLAEECYSAALTRI